MNINDLFPSRFGPDTSPASAHRVKKLPDEVWEKVIEEMRSLLHASRDCLRNQFNSGMNQHAFDPSKTPWTVNDGYYGEAFGMLRSLVAMGYAYYGANNTPAERENAQWLFSEVCNNVLQEENFDGSGECDHCLEKWGKDDAGRTR